MFDKSDLNQFPEIDKVLDSFNGSDGGFKQVFACIVNGKKNAVKVTRVADRNGVNDIIVSRLKRELDLLGALNSPFLPRLGDLTVRKFVKLDSTFIVYSEEFIEGSDVSELIQNHIFKDEGKVVKLIHDVSVAIQIYWNYQRTVHRDVKPANIRYSETNNNFILIDAGIALIRDKTTITPTGNGSPRTPFYVSPEVIKMDKDLSFRTDLFSLGIVAYEAFTGSHPFCNDHMRASEINNAILNIEQPPLVPKGVLTPKIANLIMNMLRKRPHQRPNNLDQIINMTNII